MTTKNFSKVIFLICILLFIINTVNASDINENITEIEIYENTDNGQIITEDCLLTQNNENISTNLNYSSLIICNENYTIIKGLNNNLSSNLPNYYLNNYSPIKNQGNSNNCWAFAAISTLESNILKINQTLNYDFSENNMKNIMSNSSNYGLRNNNVNEGGYDKMAIGYLTSWLGPILEDEDHYNLTSINTNLFNSTIHIQNVLFNVHNNTNIIKKAIYDYGAVAFSYVHNIHDYNNDYNSYYSPNNTNDMGHAICIIGWDDNFSKEK